VQWLASVWDSRIQQVAALNIKDFFAAAEEFTQTDPTASASTAPEWDFSTVWAIRSCAFGLVSACRFFPGPVLNYWASAPG